jgi:hypothetical protein
MNFNHWLLFLKGSKLILLFFAAYFNTTNIFNPSVMNLRFIAVFLFLTLAASALQAQTADEVIARYEAAAGGREKLEAIRYLEINSNLAMGMMGRTIDLPLTLVKEKGKLFRYDYRHSRLYLYSRYAWIWRYAGYRSYYFPYSRCRSSSPAI